MRAAVVRRYGPPEVVSIEEVPDPVVKPDQVLVRIRATGVSRGDARVRGFDLPRAVFWIPARLMLGVFRPRKPILGTEFAGVVEAVGERVTKFKVGDEVFGAAKFAKATGTHCELLAIDEDEAIAPKPERMSFEEAACVSFGCLTAGYFLRRLGKLKTGERVLIIGASGAVGCAAVQIAKHAGATVVGVCSGANAELVKSIGADEVIDYTKRDYTDAAVVGEPFDVVFDTVGASSLGACKAIMTENGRFLAAVMGVREMVQMLTNGLRTRKLRSGVDPQSPEELERCRAMIEEGAYRSVIDSEYPLEEIVEAHRRADSDRKRGSVVVRVSGGAD